LNNDHGSPVRCLHLVETKEKEKYQPVQKKWHNIPGGKVPKQSSGGAEKTINLCKRKGKQRDHHIPEDKFMVPCFDNVMGGTEKENRKINRKTTINHHRDLHQL